MVPSHARIPLIPYPGPTQSLRPTSNYHDNNLVGGFNLRRKAIWGELPLARVPFALPALEPFSVGALQLNSASDLYGVHPRSVPLEVPILTDPRSVL